MVDGGARARLTPADWARAGLDALREAGVAGVRVEPVAARLGATKGSFYWHFADRAALVDAVLELWEQVGTEDVIERLAELPAPQARLRRLFELTFESPEPGRADAVVLASAADPHVAPVLHRVTRRRLDYMALTLEAAGVAPEDAQDRALLVYVTWIGLVQLAAAVPASIPDGADRQRFLDGVLVGLEGLVQPTVPHRAHGHGPQERPGR